MATATVIAETAPPAVVLEEAAVIAISVTTSVCTAATASLTAE